MTVWVLEESFEHLEIAPEGFGWVEEEAQMWNDQSLIVQNKEDIQECYFPYLSKDREIIEDFVGLRQAIKQNINPELLESHFRYSWSVESIWDTKEKAIRRMENQKRFFGTIFGFAVQHYKVFRITPHVVESLLEGVRFQIPSK